MDVSITSRDAQLIKEIDAVSMKLRTAKNAFITAKNEKNAQLVLDAHVALNDATHELLELKKQHQAVLRNRFVD
jgi:hypothetical protein